MTIVILVEWQIQTRSTRSFISYLRNVVRGAHCFFCKTVQKYFPNNKNFKNVI